MSVCVCMAAYTCVWQYTCVGRGQRPISGGFLNHFQFLFYMFFPQVFHCTNVVYVCAYACVCVGTWVCMWRPKVDVGNRPGLVFHLFIGTGSFSWTHNSSTWLVSLASLLWDPVSAFGDWSYRWTALLTRHLMWVFRDPQWYSAMRSKHLNRWAIFLAPTPWFFLKSCGYYLFMWFVVCVCARVCVFVCHNTCLRSEASLKESVFSFYHTGPGDGTSRYHPWQAVHYPVNCLQTIYTEFWGWVFSLSLKLTYW